MATIDENRELTAHFVQLCPMLVGCEELAVEFKPIRSGDKTNGLTINPCALDVSSLLGFTPFQLSKTTAAAYYYFASLRQDFKSIRSTDLSFIGAADSPERASFPLRPPPPNFA